jgi:hypothetical protein
MHIIANFIAFLHLLFIVFVTTTPFITDSPFLLLYYCFILFFVMVHWYLNDDTCVLTLLESRLRGKKNTDTFMGRLLKPIYNVSSDEIKYIAIFLFIFAFLKIRLWDKERYDSIGRTLYVKYKLLYNKIKYNNEEYNDKVNNLSVSTYHVFDFLINPIKSSN